MSEKQTTIRISGTHLKSIADACNSDWSLSDGERTTAGFVRLLIENKELVLDKIRKKQN